VPRLQGKVYELIAAAICHNGEIYCTDKYLSQENGYPENLRY
jgi:hypothetical protein